MDAVLLAASGPPSVTNDLKLTKELFNLIAKLAPAARHLTCRMRNDDFYTDRVCNSRLTDHVKVVLRTSENLHTVPGLSAKLQLLHDDVRKFRCSYSGCNKVNMFTYFWDIS